MKIIDQHTGKIYRSYKAAARDFGSEVTHGIKRACKRGSIYTAFGHRWARVK